MYAFMIGACIICKQPFTFNPNKVPSIMVDDKKEPLCKTCHEDINLLRKSKGLQPWPEPQSGAYEGAPEEEINWG